MVERRIYIIKDPYANEGFMYRFLERDVFMDVLKHYIQDGGSLVNLKLGYINPEDHDLIIHTLDNHTLRVAIVEE